MWSIQPPQLQTPQSASGNLFHYQMDSANMSLVPFIEAELNHEIRELIVDHATHLNQNYFRPTEEQVLQEYLKAESLLTIDPSLRLQHEIQTLRVEKNSWEELRKEVDGLKESAYKGLVGNSDKIELPNNRNRKSFRKTKTYLVEFLNR